MLGADQMKVIAMSKWREPRSGWISRAMRGYRLDRNPLRRRSDRTETAILAGALVAFLAGGPFAALGGGGVSHALAMDAQRGQLATELRVTAVTTQSAPAPAATGTVGLSSYPVTARWTAPDAPGTSGKVFVALGTPAGTHIPVWSTRDGQLAAQPLTSSQVASLTSLGQVMGVGALALALGTATGLARHELDRRRLAAWDADWAAVDAHGTRRQ
jgi:hypothetical protein